MLKKKESNSEGARGKYDVLKNDHEIENLDNNSPKNVTWKVNATSYMWRSKL